MLTARGWWFLFFTLLLFGLAVVVRILSLRLISTTLLLWFLGSWFLFHFKIRWLMPRLRVHRQVLAGEDAVDLAWAGMSLEVRVRLEGPRLMTFPWVLAIDRVPGLARWQAGEVWNEGRLAPESPLEIRYTIRCPSAGRLLFFGMHVRFFDPQGFFFTTTWVRQEESVRVLPPPTDEPRTSPLRKRQHMIPLIGSHRFLRSGTGTELLDLRDYMVGDPPKLIAWKASARRDRLITKEYESEVPIRCTLFVDTSSSVRIGPLGENALARLVEISSAVAYSNTEQRDLTGLVAFDERAVTKWVRAGRGKRALYHLLGQLADLADLPPTSDFVYPDLLLSYAYGVAQDFYPERLEPDVNQVPWYWPRFWFRRGRWRKRLSALFAVRYHLGPGGVAQLLADDAGFYHCAQNFLAEHQVACPLRLLDDQGRNPYAAPGKIDVLSQALHRAILHGQENELFVLMIELADLEERMEPLLRSIRLARAKHHQVLAVIPWPFGVDLPGQPQLAEPPRSLQEQLFRAQTVRLHANFEKVKRLLAAQGAPTLCAARTDSVRLILERVHRLRGWQSR